MFSISSTHNRETIENRILIIVMSFLAIGLFMSGNASHASHERESLTGIDNEYRKIVSTITMHQGPINLSNWDYVGRWGEGSDVSLAFTERGISVWECIADRKGQRVGKAYVTKNFPGVTHGEVVEAQATYLIRDMPDKGSLYLMDFECRHCGPPGKAGIRIFLRSGRLGVNRSKLGLDDDFISIQENPVPVGKPFTLSVRLLLGSNDGKTTVLVNGKPVLHRTGINMPLQEIANRFSIKLKQEQLDYVQFGITANSTTRRLRLQLSNVTIQTFR